MANRGETPAKSTEATAEMRLLVSPDARHGGRVRQAIVEFARAHEIEEADVSALLTAVGEALANAIEHAATERAIEVACRIEGDRLIATVVDAGVGFEPARFLPTALPPAEAERGRGLPIMRRCTDLFSVRSSPGVGTAVMLGRYIERGAKTTARRRDAARAPVR